MAGGSTKVILVSLSANFGIAVSKFAGAMFTGSASLMAESVHSLSDCGNQALLLYGQRASKRPPNAHYPLGRSKELFFWSFVVAFLLFSTGGVFSIYEGVHKIQHPEPLSYPLVGIGILVVAMALEGFAFWTCIKEVRHQLHGDTMWQWIKKTTSADLLVIFLEDAAALFGLVFALIALNIAWITGNGLWDGIGSCAIGVLLIVTAVILAREVKQMLIGQMPSIDYQPKIEALLEKELPGARLVRFIALQQGVGEVLVAYKVHPADMNQAVGSAIAAVNAFEIAVKNAYPEIKWQFAELDAND